MLLEQEKEKKEINKLFVVGFIIGALIIAVIIGLLLRKPSMDDQKANILQGAYTEGSPEFQDLQKDIIISTDTDRTVQSPMAAGTISMFIHGNIRNKGTKTLTILEINAAVVTQFKTVLKEKRVLVVPVQLARLDPGQTVPVTLTMDGFSRDDDRADIRWKVTAIAAEGEENKRGNLKSDPEQHKTDNKITITTFNNLEMGISLDDASRVLGATGTLVSENKIGNISTKLYRFSCGFKCSIDLSFTNDRLTQKSQSGL